MTIGKTYITCACALIGSFVLIYLFMNADDVPELNQALTKLKGDEEQTDKMPYVPKSSKIFADIIDLAQDDPQVIEYLRGNVIHRPSKGPYRLNRPEIKDFSQFGQPLLANELVFHGKKNGFFVEVGAVNGELYSNSLFLERELGWTGILIEPNYDTFSQLTRKNRKSYHVHGALASNKSPAEIHMRNAGYNGVGSSKIKEGGMVIKAYPLYSLLLAVNVTTIDFFSLDVEGQELAVLNTLPWDKVKILVICVESTNVPPQGLKDKLLPLGYKYIGRRENDLWFIHPEVWKEGMSV